MRFVRTSSGQNPPASLIMDLARPPCGWSSRDTALPLEERLCMLPGDLVGDRVLCEAHRVDLLRARARRARRAA